MDKPQLLSRFGRCDRDGDGKIDVAEFGALLDELGVGYSEAQVRAAFEDIDVNESGLIDYDEFTRWWSHH